MIELSVGNGTVSVESDGTDWDAMGGYRQRYTYVITADGWQYVGNDMYSGVAASVNEHAAMGDLLGFLGACAESRQYRDRNGYGGENADLFPDHVAEWACEYSDDIAIAGMDYEDISHY